MIRYYDDPKNASTNTAQVTNTQTANNYNNQASVGSYPYAQQGSQIASQTGAASAGATQQQAVNTQQQQPQTFSQLQQQGYARPAPPPTAPAPMPAGYNFQAPQQQPFQSPLNLQQSIQQLLANPDPYQNENFQREFRRGSEQIDDQYNAEAKAVNEEMARRGIYDSTIAGGRLHDTALGRRGALQDLMDRIAGQSAQSYAQNRLGGVNAALNYEQMLRQSHGAAGGGAESAADRELRRYMFDREQGYKETEGNRRFGMDEAQWNDRMQQTLLEMFGVDPTTYDLSGSGAITSDQGYPYADQNFGRDPYQQVYVPVSGGLNPQYPPTGEYLRDRPSYQELFF